MLKRCLRKHKDNLGLISYIELNRQKLKSSKTYIDPPCQSISSLSFYGCDPNKNIVKFILQICLFKQSIRERKIAKNCYSTKMAKRRIKSLSSLSSTFYVPFFLKGEGGNQNFDIELEPSKRHIIYHLITTIADHDRLMTAPENAKSFFSSLSLSI